MPDSSDLQKHDVCRVYINLRRPTRHFCRHCAPIRCQCCHFPEKMQLLQSATAASDLKGFLYKRALNFVARPAGQIASILMLPGIADLLSAKKYPV
jgi:hypothetical protein